MKITQNADSAARGVSDISGVKDVSLSCPEGESEDGLRVADGENETGVADTDAAALDEEFERLIQGRYKQAYKKRMQSVIRRRVRSGKARPEFSAKVCDASEATPLQAESTVSSDSSGGETDRGEGKPQNAEFGVTGELKTPNLIVPDNKKGDDAERDTALVERAMAKNKSRPIENGLGGSCGIVTKINVSALSGSDVLSILKRVGTGERISFK